MNRPLRLLALLAACALAPAQAGPTAPAAPPEPPRAAQRPVVTEIHGERLVDPYRWLRERGNPAVRAYLEAENAYARDRMALTRGLQDKLYGEMLGRIVETDRSAPWRQGDWLYYTRTEKGQQYPIHCRVPARDPEAAEQVLLDLNAMGRGKPFMEVPLIAPSPDGRLLAYLVDETGYRQFRLRVLDMQRGRVLPVARQRVTSVAWGADSRSLWYSTEDATTKRSDRVLRMDVRSGRGATLFIERDERFSVGVEATRSGEKVLATSQSYTTTEVRAWNARAPKAPPQVLLPRRAGVEYFAEHRGTDYWLRINDTGRNFRLVRVPQDAVSPARFVEVLPARAAVMLEGVDAFRDRLVLSEREGGVPQITILDPDSGARTRVTMPEPVYEAQLGPNPVWDAASVRIQFESFTTPESSYDYAFDTGALGLVKRREVPDYRPADYVSERIEIIARDGTAIPVSLVYRRGARARGAAPLLLAGYGSYGFPYPVEFNSNRASLLDRGMIFAVAHVRGGGEFGKPWHDAGKLQRKQNTFNDFIDSAEGLIARGVTAPDRLAIIGGSAGGLLLGAVLNQRPELFRVAINYVPFVDVINTMLDPTIPLTTGEFEEWGNPRQAADYAVMRAYSPYDNLAAQPYPTMLVKTSLNDSQVGYWEPAKYVAKLRATRTDRNELLFVTEMAGGHGGRSGRYDALRDDAFDYAFLLTRLGVLPRAVE